MIWGGEDGLPCPLLLEMRFHSALLFLFSSFSPSPVLSIFSPNCGHLHFTHWQKVVIMWFVPVTNRMWWTTEILPSCGVVVSLIYPILAFITRTWHSRLNSLPDHRVSLPDGQSVPGKKRFVKSCSCQRPQQCFTFFLFLFYQFKLFENIRVCK